MFFTARDGIVFARHQAMERTRRFDDPSFLISDAAVLLGVSRRTVYYWIRQRRLETVRTRGGSQRVLLSSIARRLRESRGLPVQEELEREIGVSEAEPLTFQVQPLPRNTE